MEPRFFFFDEDRARGFSGGGAGAAADPAGVLNQFQDLSSTLKRVAAVRGTGVGARDGVSPRRGGIG